ncbi:hypothetical protein ACFLS1_05040 [Verrucomicrobiota bacterium]
MHSSFHFALGLALGTLTFLPAILRRLLFEQRMAFLMRKWLWVSYALGIFAIIPNILRRIGTPEPVCTGWQMNIFLFHPLINNLKSGGMLIGLAVIIICFIIQYSFLTAAIALSNKS